MAILKDGVNGGFTGKVGSVVGYQLNGKRVIRGLPKPSKKNQKGSAGQHKCRGKFAIMQYFLSHVLNFVRVGFNIDSKAKGMSAHNAAKSYNMFHGFDGDGKIDYSQIILAQGKLLPPENHSVVFNELGLLFTWDKQTDAGYLPASDQVMLLAFDDKKDFSICITSGNRRSIGEQLLSIPKARQAEAYHTWIAFVSEDRTMVSNSIYAAFGSANPVIQKSVESL
jgi:hypothetical protein